MLLPEDPFTTEHAAEIAQINFYGETVTVQKTADGYYVALKPLCTYMGISYSAQRRRLLEQPWARMSTIRAVGADNKTYDMFSIDDRTLTMWLTTLDTSRFKSEQSKKKVALYQCEVANVINDYFWKRATNIAPTNAALPSEDSSDLQSRVERAETIIRQLIEDRHRDSETIHTLTQLVQSLLARPDVIEAVQQEEEPLNEVQRYIVTEICKNGYVRSKLALAKAHGDIREHQKNIHRVRAYSDSIRIKGFTNPQRALLPITSLEDYREFWADVISQAD